MLDPPAIEAAEPTATPGPGMLRLLAEQFLEHRLAVVGLVVIGVFVAAALAAPLLARGLGARPDDQNVLFRFQPFNALTPPSADVLDRALNEFVRRDPEQAQRLAAIVVPQQLLTDPEIADAGGDDEELLAIAWENMRDPAFAARLAALEGEPFGELLAYRAGLRSRHLLGTDELGRDLLIRLVYGARVSIGIGLLVGLVAGVIGLLLGSLAGYFGGLVDAALMRFTDALLSLPMVPVLIIMAAIDLGKIPVFGLAVGGRYESMLKMVAILAFFSWMETARVVRGSVLSVKERDFVLAARALGASHGRIVLGHIVPNVIGPLIVAVTLNIGNAVLYESALSFLGLGIQPPTPSWGRMICDAQSLIYDVPRLAILPGSIIFLLVISFNFVGDGLHGAFDPRSVQRRQPWRQDPRRDKQIGSDDSDADG